MKILPQPVYTEGELTMSYPWPTTQQLWAWHHWSQPPATSETEWPKNRKLIKYVLIKLNIPFYLKRYSNPLNKGHLILPSTTSELQGQPTVILWFFCLMVQISRPFFSRSNTQPTYPNQERFISGWALFQGRYKATKPESLVILSQIVPTELPGHWTVPNSPGEWSPSDGPRWTVMIAILNIFT